MAISPNRRLLARLYQDLAELQDNPYPGVAVFTDDANLRKLCLVLTPSGPWKDLALHFDVELPDNWPTVPPKVATSVDGIKHPNLYGNYICCDLLKPLEHLQRGYTGGYTPALTLRGLFLQFLTFFSSTKVDQDYGDSIEIGDATCVSYLWEQDLEQDLPPGDCKCKDQCPCADLSMQKSLAVVWESGKAKEVMVQTHSAGTGHKKKHMRAQDQFLHRLEWPNPRRISTIMMIANWTCKICPYGSPALPHDRTTLGSTANATNAVPSILLQPPSICQIQQLNDDTLGALASHLPSESIITLSIAYPRFRDIVAFLHVLRQRELTCFFLRSSLRQTVLGVGVALDAGARTLSSDFDWLSMEAFDVFKVRKSIQKRPFDFFLPIAFNRPHFRKSEREVWKRLAVIETALRTAEANISKKSGHPSNRRLDPPLKPHHTVDVLYRMMNNIVVSLMKSCDDSMQTTNRYHETPTLLRASEKAVVSYCHLFHLLIRLCATTPAILHDATWKLRTFVMRPEARLKSHTPDMGELIVIVMLVLILPPIDDKPPMTWELLCGKYLEEVITRNVRWVLKDVPHLEVLEKGPSDYRLNKTFACSKTSLRLMMFQITFLDLFIRTYSSNISRLDDNYGFPDNELPERMVSEIKEIYKVDAWPKFFQRVQFAKGLAFTKETFSQMLRDCVQQSAVRRYHTPAGNNRLQQLTDQRAALENSKMVTD
ncbi:hypothetical protein BDZ97DRAFT_1659465 [Flammula alnicola]|nr:hypothetical protein BDZ97DRAFT_1659465 [Flammula alnicola]